MNLTKLHDDILIEIQRYLELHDIQNISLTNSVFYSIFTKYRKTIYINIFKRKGFSNLLLFFLTSKNSKRYIKDFYTLDKSLRLSNDNILASYKKENYVLCKFLLANVQISNKIHDLKKQHNDETDYYIYKILYYRKPIDEEFVKQILVELIHFRFHFSCKDISDSLLDELIMKSEFMGNINDNLKQNLKSDIINVINSLTLNNLHSIMYSVSAMTNIWEYWLRDEGRNHCKIYKLLSSSF